MKAVQKYSFLILCLLLFSLSGQTIYSQSTKKYEKYIGKAKYNKVVANAQKNGVEIKIPVKEPLPTDLTKKAEEVLGTPWKHASMDPNEGFDCSGFVIWTYHQFGYELPHMTELLAKIGDPVSIEEARPTDIVCFGSKEYIPNRVYHVGMVHSVNPDAVQMIHCSTSIGVSIAPITSGYWSEVEYFIVRVGR